MASAPRVPGAWMTFARGALADQDVLDEVLPHLVVEIEVHADDEAGDEDDRGAADDRLLVRPLDLLQLGDRLLEEADDRDAAARDVGARSLGARLGALHRGLLRGTLPRSRPERRRAGRLGAPLAALLTSRAGH